ncbi:MAG: glycosyltransferase family 39 protein [Planctomycetaceae bacterium]|nr:glycosyltransferase family 39 protein [Planctomycetaceae bacterium]
MINRFSANIILLAIMCGAFFLIANLGNQYLWQDEAETALVSKTILTEGVPRGYDGKNFFSQELGSDYGKNYIWHRLMWLPYYTVAGCYAVFGVSTITSRLPFALFGIASVYLTYLFVLKWWGSERKALLSATMLTFCVAFLILCRQCRYYSLVIFFSMLSLYAYAMFLEQKKYSRLMLVLSATLLFHSQHINIGIIFGTTLLHTMIFRRNRLKDLLIVIAAVLIINGPWIIWLTGINFAVAYGTNVMPFYLSIVLMISDIVHYVFPPWLLLLAAGLLIFKRIKTGAFFADKHAMLEKISLPIFFIIFNMLTILIVSPFPFFRYMAPSIPILIILMALIIDMAAGVHSLLAAAAIIAVIATGQFRYYIYEITHDFDGPMEGICKYLNEHGEPNDTVAIDYGDMPVKFYTKMRVVGGLTGENLEPAKNAKWVILRKYSNCSKDIEVKRYLIQNINFVNYRRVVIDYPDTMNENREYPGQHYFATQKYEDRVVIYERMN